MTNDIIFLPFKLKNFTLKNRIGVAPMTRMSSPGHSIPRQDVLDFLVRRAENSAAIVYTEAIVTDYESAQGYPKQARLITQRQIEAWKPVVEAIRKEGAVSIMQMFHCGRMAWPEDIQHVITGFVETARGAIAAGFDSIEIHGAHGYLINNFLSSYSNRRTDEYGGSVENRYRFAHEIVQAVRQVVPPDRLLTFRISNWGVADMEVSLFENRSEWQQIIKMLSKEPIDAISVSTYDYSAKAFGTDQTMAQLTREATDLPLMICGKIYDRATAEDALKHADIVLSAKSILLNPNWVEDIRQSKELRLYKSEDANVAYTDEPLP